jgi:hypothetical protein
MFLWSLRSFHLTDYLVHSVRVRSDSWFIVKNIQAHYKAYSKFGHGRVASTIGEGAVVICL